MPIGYDNAAGRCLRSEGLEEGHWYVADDGSLFIVPNDAFGGAEIEGPDGEIIDRLNAVYRQTAFDSVDPAIVGERLGLGVVFGWQRRFDSQSGYYYA